MTIPKLLQLARDNAAVSKPIRAESNGREATIYLHGLIGGWWGDIDPTMFAQALAATSAEVIHLRIDSPGGDVFDARSMMTAIAQHSATVIAHVDGLAASAASGICMACDEVEISQGAQIMIHEGWTVTIGNKRDHEKAHGLLDKVDTSLINDYVRRTDNSVEQVTTWLEDETWFTADEAVEHGFADRKVEVVQKRTKNAWNLSAYKNTPAALLQPGNTATDGEAIIAHQSALSRRLALLERAPA